MFIATPTFMAFLPYDFAELSVHRQGSARGLYKDVAGRRKSRPRRPAALGSDHESLRFRPARLWREPRPYKGRRRAAVSLEQTALQEIGRAHVLTPVTPIS